MAHKSRSIFCCFLLKWKTMDFRLEVVGSLMFADLNIFGSSTTNYKQIYSHYKGSPPHVCITLGWDVDFDTIQKHGYMPF